MGNMIGSGVYLLPASLAPFGWNGVIAWLFAISGALLLALVIVALTRAYPQSGGTSAFVGRAFGSAAEFFIGWGYLMSVIVGIAALAMAAVSYASSLLPWLAGSGRHLVAAIGLVWLLTLLNMRGLRAAAGFQVATLFLKIVPLALVVLLAANALGRGEAHATPFVPSALSVDGISGAAALVLFAMLGFECASLAAARVERPQINIARSTLIGTLLVGAIYLVASSAVVLLLPQAEVASSPAPFATFVERFWAPGAARFVAGFAVVSCIGAINGWILISAEMMRDMAARGELPCWFAEVNARSVPLRSLCVTGIAASACLALNASGSMQGIFEFLLLLSTSSALWLYLACALAAIRLGVARALGTFGALYAVWTLWGAGVGPSGWSVALMAAGLPVHWWTRRR